MMKTVDALDRIADAALSELSDARPTDDAVGAAVAAAENVTRVFGACALLGD